MAQAAAEGEKFGYDEININIGCPSDRVQNGRFGACLMAEPDLVADGVSAIRDHINLPVTVKTRIGIDDRDSYEQLLHFVRTVASADCRTFIIQARKAWLNGLSPKANRIVPPLRYELAYQLKRDFPHLEIILNGGVKTLADAQTHGAHVDGVMIGREGDRIRPLSLGGPPQPSHGLWMRTLRVRSCWDPWKTRWPWPSFWVLWRRVQSVWRPRGVLPTGTLYPLGKVKENDETENLGRVFLFHGFVLNLGISR